MDSSRNSKHVLHGQCRTDLFELKRNYLYCLYKQFISRECPCFANFLNVSFANKSVTDLFSDASGFTSYVVFRIGNLFLISANIKGGLASGWTTVATIDSSKYKADYAFTCRASNGYDSIQVQLAAPYVLRRYATTSLSNQYSFTLMAIIYDV